jgi:hypothetical protein
MIRARSEAITFNRDDLEKVARHMAQSQIAGSSFIGKFGEQSVRWLPDGSIEVTTTYVHGSYEDLPQLTQEEPETSPAVSGKRKR